MASLIVRRLDDDLVRRLKARAASHGRSAEAEHRAIRETALRPKVTGVALWAKLSKGAKADLDVGAGVRDAVASAEIECTASFSTPTSSQNREGPRQILRSGPGSSPRTWTGSI